MLLARSKWAGMYREGMYPNIIPGLWTCDGGPWGTDGDTRHTRHTVTGDRSGTGSMTRDFLTRNTSAEQGRRHRSEQRRREREEEEDREADREMQQERGRETKKKIKERKRKTVKSRKRAVQEERGSPRNRAVYHHRAQYLCVHLCVHLCILYPSAAEAPRLSHGKPPALYGHSHGLAAVTDSCRRQQLQTPSPSIIHRQRRISVYL